MDHFLVSHQNFSQNSARNPKIGFKIFFVKKWQNFCSFQGLKINFWIQRFYRIFWQVTGNYYNTWMRQKVEVNSYPQHHPVNCENTPVWEPLPKRLGEELLRQANRQSVGSSNTEKKLFLFPICRVQASLPFSRPLVWKQLWSLGISTNTFLFQTIESKDFPLIQQTFGKA